MNFLKIQSDMEDKHFTFIRKKSTKKTTGVLSQERAEADTQVSRWKQK